MTCCLTNEYNSQMHYSDQIISKSALLALSIVSVSNLQLPILDMLSKYNHHYELTVTLDTIFAMGLVSIDMNNVWLVY